MNTLTVSILNYNGKEVIERCVECVRNQTIKPDRILLIDNSSTDNSWKLVVNKVSSVLIKDNKFQFITGLNAAFESAGDGIVLFVSNDVFLDKECIEKLLDAPYDITWPKFYGPSQKNGISGKEFESRKKTIMTACFMMSKEMFEHIGPFDTNLAPAYYEDLDYSIRAKKLGYTIGQCKDAFVTHYANHSFSKVYTKKQMRSWCKSHAWYVFKKHYLPWLTVR